MSAKQPPPNGERVLNPKVRGVNDSSSPGARPLGRHLENRPRNAVIVEQPMEFRHRPFPPLEAYEGKRETENVAEQNPRPPLDLAAIGFADIDDFALEHECRTKKQGKGLGGRTEQGVDGIAVMGIAERHRDEDEATGSDNLDAAPGQSVGIAYVLQNVAAQNCFWRERPDPR